jgi:hypothetical protein
MPPSALIEEVRFAGDSSLAFLNTVRTERFDQILSLTPLLPSFAQAA